MHTKNNYHKVLGIIYLAVIFAAIVSLIYLWQVGDADIFIYPIRVEEKTVYTNESYNFDIEYLNNYRADISNTAPNYFRSGGQTIISVSLPSALYDRTNFGLGRIAVAVKEKSNPTDCKTYVSSANTSKVITQTAKIDPGTFYVDTFMGAAAGTSYRTEIYRILKGSVCFEANLTVGIANINNFEPGSVTEVVEADVWNALSVMLMSLEFKD